MITKNRVLALVLVAVVIILTTAINGQFQVQSGSAKRTLEGAWRVHVTRLPATDGTVLPPYEALVTYVGGGGLVETNSAKPDLFSTGPGEWEFTGQGTFSVTFVRLLKDGNGAFAGTTKVRETIRRSGLSNYTSVRKEDFFLPLYSSAH